MEIQSIEFGEHYTEKEWQEIQKEKKVKEGAMDKYCTKCKSLKECLGQPWLGDNIRNNVVNNAESLCIHFEEKTKNG